MRKLVLKMSLSADGFVGGPKGELDWLFKNMSAEGSAWTEKKVWEAGLHIMGSRTFYDMIHYWPTSKDPLAAPMNEIPKAVFTKKGIDLAATHSSTQALKDATQNDRQKGIAPAGNATWTNYTVLNGDLATEIKKLKQQDGKLIMAHGGAGFAQSLIKTGLVDEFQLLVFPVALGQGLPIFSKLEQPLDLKLQSSTTFKAGVVANVYKAA